MAKIIFWNREIESDAFNVNSETKIFEVPDYSRDNNLNYFFTNNPTEK